MRWTLSTQLMICRCSGHAYRWKTFPPMYLQLLNRPSAQTWPLILPWSVSPPQTQNMPTTIGRVIFFTALHCKHHRNKCISSPTRGGWMQEVFHYLHLEKLNSSWDNHWNPSIRLGISYKPKSIAQQWAPRLNSSWVEFAGRGEMDKDRLYYLVHLLLVIQVKALITLIAAHISSPL